MYNLDFVDPETDHFPGRMLNSQRCKHCDAIGKRKNKKSKYKCLACSVNFQTDIPLCIQCWGEFHEVVLPVCRNFPAKDIKRAYQTHTRKNILNNFDFTRNVGACYTGN